MLKLLKNEQYCHKCRKQSKIRVVCEPELHELISRLVEVDDLTEKDLQNYKKEIANSIKKEFEINSKKTDQVERQITLLKRDIRKEKDPRQAENVKWMAMEIENLKKCEKEMDESSALYNQFLNEEIKRIDDLLEKREGGLKEFESNAFSWIYEAHAVGLPYKIKSIHLKDYAMFKDITYNFKKTNLITGGNASGKTILLNALQGKINDPKSKVTINTYPKRTKKIAGKDFAECILIDNPLPMLAKKEREKFVEWLKNNLKDKQIIMTSLQELKGFENVIRLKRIK